MAASRPSKSEETPMRITGIETDRTGFAQDQGA
jgi:hypothetical protein